jgi:iron complex transport system substrate-binding protein
MIAFCRKKMPSRGLVLALCAALTFATAPAAARSVTDSAGRTVALPDKVSRVFTAGPPASALLYVLAPQAMLGWGRAPRADEKPFLLPQTRDLPELGRLTGRGDSVNLEALVAAKPDVIIDVGSVSPIYRSLAERVQAQTGIPYLLIDGSFANTPAALRLLGDILDAKPRAETLARATEAIFAEADAVLARVPAAQRPRVYLARGPGGLQSGSRGSINTEIIERVGGINVVDGIGQRPGLVSLSPEQLLVFAPDTVISLDAGFPAMAKADPVWQRIEAVQRGRVHVAPALPFGWIDSPPGINRLIGVQWLLHKFYPGAARGALGDKVRAYFSLFYQVDLDDAALARLLGPDAP